MEFSTYLHNEKMKNGLTSQQLAEKLTVKKRTIDEWLQGRVIPKPLTIYAVKSILSGKVPISQ